MWANHDKPICKYLRQGHFSWNRRLMIISECIEQWEVYHIYEYIWHFHIIAYFRAFKCLRIVKRCWIKNCFELAKEHIRDLFGQGVGNVLTLAGCVSIQNLIEQRAKHLTRSQGAEQGHHGLIGWPSPPMMEWVRKLGWFSIPKWMEKSKPCST